MAFFDWLRSGGFGGKAAAPPPEQRAAPAIPYPVFLPNPIALGTLVHGPGATEALRAAYGDGYALNSAVYACIQAIQRTYTEAPVRAWQRNADGDKAEPILPHPATDLLEHPNAHMTGNLMLAYVQYCKSVYGNAYLRKVRNGGGTVIELWPLSPAVCWPVRRRNSRNFVDFYHYQFSDGPRGVEEIPPEDIVHFRLGLDDQNHMYGMSPLRQLTREVDTDVQATAFSDRLVRNNAVPGLVVTLPPEAGDPGQATADAIKDRLSNTFAGDGQGTTAILTGGATAAQFGFNPQQLDLTGLHRLPEERIAAVLGVPAIIAGLGAGLDRATYANFKEAREMFIESTIIPAYADDDAVLNEQYLAEFSDDPTIYLQHDISDMRALQPDMDAMFTRLTLAVGGAWLSKNEARSEAGFTADPDPESDIIGGAPDPDPAMPDASMEDPNAPTPLRRTGSKAMLTGVDMERALRVLRAAQEGPLADALQQLLDEQRARVLHRMGGQ
jgi:HK97 family phage portal protein